jgi:hypothetical protein
VHTAIRDTVNRQPPADLLLVDAPSIRPNGLSEAVRVLRVARRGYVVRMTGQPEPDPWRRRRAAIMLVSAGIALVVVGWATFGQGSWLIAALAVAGALGFGHALRRRAREFRAGTSGDPDAGSGVEVGTRVVVERPASGYADRLRGYRVMVDGRSVARLPGLDTLAPEADRVASVPSRRGVDHGGSAALAAHPRR